MSDWIYCGTQPPVDLFNTASLLRYHEVIWFPPDPGWAQFPQGHGIQPGDMLWLVWKPMANTNFVILIGGGIVIPTLNLTVEWFDADFPGIYQASRNFGYPVAAGLGNTQFLRLQPCTVLNAADFRAFTSLGQISNRLNQATVAQSSVLRNIIP